MSLLGQTTLVSLLSDSESLAYLVREGVPLEIIPTEDLRPVVDWSLRHFGTTGQAPTPMVLVEEFGNALSDHEIDPGGDVEETVEWALDDLKASYVRNQAGVFSREMVQAITECAKEDRVDVLAEYASRLTSTVTSLQPRSTQIDMRTSAQGMLDDYYRAAADPGLVQGMAFGLQQVDAYTGGIREGELAILAGGPKSGKSWFANRIAYHQWRLGVPTALFTLENSIKMTQMRIACIANHISTTDLQMGTLEAHELEMLETWVHEELETSDCPLLIFQPPSRTPQTMVQMAKAHGSEHLIIDQLTFMEAADRKRERRDEIASILRDLKLEISTGRQQMACLLMHQINREGVKSAERTGVIEPYHMAEASEVERVLDWGFGLYRSHDHIVSAQAQLQTFGARRAPRRHFDLLWDLDTANILVRGEAFLDD